MNLKEKILRPYQVGAHRAADMWLNNTKSRIGSIVMAMGMGKTFTTSSFIARKLKTRQLNKVLWVTHRDNLVRQAQTQLSETIGKPCGIEQAGKRAGKEDNVVVASVQSLNGDRLEDFAQGFTPDLIVMDEGHHGDAPSYQAIKAKWPKAKVLNLTATPYHGEVTNTLEAIGDIIYHKSPQDAIDMGMAVPVKQLYLDIKELRNVAYDASGDYEQTSLKKVMKADDVMDYCVEKTAEFLPGKKSIIFAVDVEHGTNLVERYAKKGVRAALVTGEMGGKEQQRLKDEFMQGKYDALINHNVFTEGTDIPEVENILNLRPTPLTHTFMQMAGRGMRLLLDPQTHRPMKDYAGNLIKPECLVIDVTPYDLTPPNTFIPRPNKWIERRNEGWNGKPLTEVERFASCLYSQDDIETWLESGKAPLSMTHSKLLSDSAATLAQMQDEYEAPNFESLVVSLQDAGVVYCWNGLPVDKSELQTIKDAAELALNVKTKQTVLLDKEVQVPKQGVNGIIHQGADLMPIGTWHMGGCPKVYVQVNDKWMEFVEKERKGRKLHSLEHVSVEEVVRMKNKYPLQSAAMLEQTLAAQLGVDVIEIRSRNMSQLQLQWLSNLQSPRYLQAVNYVQELAQAHTKVAAKPAPELAGR